MQCVCVDNTNEKNDKFKEALHVTKNCALKESLRLVLTFGLIIWD